MERKLKVCVAQDSVILVTFGPQSSCVFMLMSQYQKWVKANVEPSERACVMVTPTNYDVADIEFLSKSNDIIKRLESEISEQREMVATRMKQRKRA